MDPGRTRLTVSGQALLAYGKPHLPSNLRWAGLRIWVSGFRFPVSGFPFSPLALWPFSASPAFYHRLRFPHPVTHPSNPGIAKQDVIFGAHADVDAGDRVDVVQ